jgi:hypothetical protein
MIMRLSRPKYLQLSGDGDTKREQQLILRILHLKHRSPLASNKPFSRFIFNSLKNIYKATPQPVVTRGPINTQALQQNFMKDNESIGPEGNLTLSDFINNHGF